MLFLKPNQFYDLICYLTLQKTTWADEGVHGRMTVQISTAAEKLELLSQADLHFVRKGNGGGSCRCE